jgi:hypothetical protein
MADENEAQDGATPTPDPALKRLRPLIGTWNLKGSPLGSDKGTITGIAVFKWLHTEQGEDGIGFFLQQDLDMDYGGVRIKSHELIGYNPKTRAFSSFVYSNMAPDPWPYEWEVQGDTWTISIKHDRMDATFTAKFSDDGNSFSGGWRPNPGADETINAPYDIGGSRKE